MVRCMAASTLRYTGPDGRLGMVMVLALLVLAATPAVAAEPRPREGLAKGSGIPNCSLPQVHPKDGKSKVRFGPEDWTDKKGFVVSFFATWCEPCKDDMVELTKLVAKYGTKGFSVLGVNLDQDRKSALDYQRKKRHPWIHLHEAGGLESRLANEMGVLTLPTMILVDPKGKVVNRGIHVAELETELKTRLTKKK